MGQALYRNYRPKSFDDVVGQDHIVTTLKKAIKGGRISHAYLFTGPRGVGKTSIARILAHEVNGIPYDDESVHLDIIEIDAASNRRIDEIRELRDKVHISPTSAKYKVYIIDEVHMLTREAFNALLKTLEEPPAHAIFILATTEAHKLPQTIISRTQRFEFKPITRASAVSHLADIAKEEKLEIDKEALELLAEHGDGSFRDSISLLDQLSSSSKKISADEVREFLGLPPASAVASLAQNISAANTAEALANLDKLREQGANTSLIARLLAKEIRSELLANPVNDWAGKLLKDLIEVPASSRPDDSLEIAVLEACARPGSAPIAPRQTAALSSPAPKEEKPAPAETKAEQVATPSVSEPVKPTPKPPKKTSADSAQIDEQTWEEIVTRVKDQAASLYTALRLATPEAEAGKLTLAFQFPLHQKKVDQAEHKDLIGQIVAQVTGQEMTIEPVVDKNKKPAKKKADAPKEKVVIKPANDEVGAISNIFGGAEVIES